MQQSVEQEADMTDDPAKTAQTYFESWQAKDFDTLRSLLADDVTFRPIKALFDPRPLLTS
jgi:ketosteroid isomerase-like protein